MGRPVQHRPRLRFHPKEASTANVAIVLVVPAALGTTQQYNLGDYRLTHSIGQRMFRRVDIRRTTTEDLMHQHQLMSEQAQSVNHAMQQLNHRVESVLGQGLTPTIHTTPVSCCVCNGDATYEAGVAVSVVQVVGMSEWSQQWRSLQDHMRTLEQKLRECVVAPPDEQRGPRFTTCRRCSVVGVEVEEGNDTENTTTEGEEDAPLLPFV